MEVTAHSAGSTWRRKANLSPSRSENSPKQAMNIPAELDTAGKGYQVFRYQGKKTDRPASPSEKEHCYCRPGVARETVKNGLLHAQRVWERATAHTVHHFAGNPVFVLWAQYGDSRCHSQPDYTVSEPRRLQCTLSYSQM